MDISVTPELEQFLAAKVASGDYRSASDVVREALLLLEERDHLRNGQMDAFDRELTHRVTCLDQGEHVDPTAARDRLRRKSEERRNLVA